MANGGGWPVGPGAHFRHHAARDSLLEDTRFYAEWLRPQRFQHVLIALLAPSAKLVGGLFLARRTGSSPFTHNARAALRRLQPHLGHAVQVRLRLEAASSAERQALEALDVVEQAVLLVDANAAVRHANCAAEALLRSGELKAVANALTCDHPDDTRALRKVVGEASTGQDDADGATLAVRRRSGQRPLSVLVAPLRGERPFQLGPPATAILLVTDPERVDRQPTPIFARCTGSPGPRHGSPTPSWMRIGWRTSRKISASRCRPFARIFSARSRRPTRAGSRS